MTDTLLNMKAFLATTRAGSFSEAGRQLGIAPSVVTKRVGQLEWSLRAKLLKRSTRRLQLTDLGERYLDVMRQIIREYDDMAAGILRSPTELEGLLRIKAPASPLVVGMAQALSSFQTKYPRVTLDAVLIDRSVDPVEEGFDIVLTNTSGSFDGVLEEPLHVYRRALSAAPSYLARRGAPRHVRELAHHDCIVFSPVGPTWTFEGPSGVATVTIRPHLVTNSSALVLDSVLAGNGIALVSRIAGAEKFKSGALVEVLPEFRVPNLSLRALVPAARANLVRVQALLDHIRGAFQEAESEA